MATQNKNDTIRVEKEVQKRYQRELHLYRKQIEKTKKLSDGKKIA